MNAAISSQLQEEVARLSANSHAQQMVIEALIRTHPNAKQVFDIFVQQMGDRHNPSLVPGQEHVVRAQQGVLRTLLNAVDCQS